jgi:hypothetical protein
MCLSFIIAAGPRQRSYSQVRVPRNSWPHFTFSNSRLSQAGGPGPHIYFPRNRAVRLYPPGTGFPFRRILRPAGLRWRCSNPPVESSLMLRLTVSGPVCPGIKRPSRAQDNIFYYCQTVVRLLTWDALSDESQIYYICFNYRRPGQFGWR